MGRAEVVNGVLNGAVTEVEGEEMWPSKGGGGIMGGSIGWVHSMAVTPHVANLQDYINYMLKRP
jgi:hypothetical protein